MSDFTEGLTGKVRKAVDDYLPHYQTYLYQEETTTRKAEEHIVEF